MRKIVVGVILCASTLAWTGQASAAPPSPEAQCRAGSRVACEQRAFDRCVAKLTAKGYTDTEARRRCSRR